jgi:hypothetical protein
MFLGAVCYCLIGCREMIVGTRWHGSRRQNDGQKASYKDLGEPCDVEHARVWPPSPKRRQADIVPIAEECAFASGSGLRGRKQLVGQSERPVDQ